MSQRKKAYIGGGYSHKVSLHDDNEKTVWATPCVAFLSTATSNELLVGQISFTNSRIVFTSHIRRPRSAYEVFLENVTGAEVVKAPRNKWFIRRMVKVHVINGSRWFGTFDQEEVASRIVAHAAQYAPVRGVEAMTSPTEEDNNGTAGQQTTEQQATELMGEATWQNRGSRSSHRDQ